MATDRSHQVRRSLPAAGLAALLLCGCSFALGPYALIDGAEFSIEALDQLEEGMSGEEVEDLLGPPWHKRELEAGERWFYYSRFQHRSCNVYLLGFLPVQRRPKDQFRATLEFGSSGLQLGKLTEKLAGERRSMDLLQGPP